MSDAWFRQKRPPLWISPRILRKYYADFLLPDTVQDKQQHIFRAVINGTIRAKHNGRILTTEEAAALGKTRWDMECSYALPPDIQLSVEDALLVFKESHRDERCDDATRGPGSWAAASWGLVVMRARCSAAGPAKIVT